MASTLITGISGFVGQHLSRQLLTLGHRVAGVSRHQLQNSEDLCALVLEHEADVVVHLAGIRTAPTTAEVYEANVMSTARLFDAVRQSARIARVIVLSSSAVYGDSSGGVLTEASPLAPVSPYGVSKAAIELMAAQMFRLHAVPAITLRPFNIIGPGQRGDYVTAKCAQQLVEIELARRPPQLALGNLDAVRDFLDVRDLVSAIVAAIDRGRPGALYNVCSGTPVSIATVVSELGARIRQPIEVRSAARRSDDVPFQQGSFESLHAATGWQPTIELAATLDAILEDWRDELARSERS